MKVSRAIRRTAVFALRWDDVEAITANLVSHLPHITISASCADDLDRRFESLDELKNFNNSEKAAIRELRISARSTEASQASWILNTDDSNNVRFSVDASEEVAVGMNEFFEDFLDRVRPWYSKIATADWSMWLISFAGVVLGTRILAKGTANFDAALKDVTGLAVALVLFFAFFGSPLMNFAFHPIRRKYFSTGAFAFGDGERRHSSIETSRTTVITGFGISVVASVVVSWLL
jgi:hypothetical protein